VDLAVMNERGSMAMNEDILKGKWNEMKGEVKKKWGKLTDDDLMVISGEKEKLVGVLQTKYGYAKDKAEENYKEFIDRQKK
jgi:uncharacterized protein YjbJ (UPF0337 family)